MLLRHRSLGAVPHIGQQVAEIGDGLGGAVDMPGAVAVGEEEVVPKGRAGGGAPGWRWRSMA